MGVIDLSFGDVGAIPPEGIYRVVCNKAVLAPTKDKSGHNIILDLEVTDAPEDKWEGYKLRSWLSLKEAARWKLQEALEALTGEPWRDDDMKIDVDDDDEIPVLNGASCLVTLTESEYNGKSQANIKTFLADDGQFEVGFSD